MHGGAGDKGAGAPMLTAPESFAPALPCMSVDRPSPEAALRALALPSKPRDPKGGWHASHPVACCRYRRQPVALEGFTAADASPPTSRARQPRPSNEPLPFTMIASRTAPRSHDELSAASKGRRSTVRAEKLTREPSASPFLSESAVLR